MTAQRRLPGLAATAFCWAVLAGCSGDDPGDGPSAGASTPTASATTGSSTPTGSTSSAPTTPTVTGRTVQLRDFSITVPETWTVLSQNEDYSITFSDNTVEGGTIYVDDDTALPNEDLERLARNALDAAEDSNHEPRRIANRTVGGKDGYVIVGSTTAYEKYYQWGTRTDANWARVAFEWAVEPPNADQVIDQVLGTITFH